MKKLIYISLFILSLASFSCVQNRDSSVQDKEQMAKDSVDVSEGAGEGEVGEKEGYGVTDDI